MNHLLNQPGVISSTLPDGGPASASALGPRYTSFEIARCSTHWPTLHFSGEGFQFSCSAVSGLTRPIARASLASNSCCRRLHQAGRVLSGCVGTPYDKPVLRVAAW